MRTAIVGLLLLGAASASTFTFAQTPPTIKGFAPTEGHVPAGQTTVPPATVVVGGDGGSCLIWMDKPSTEIKSVTFDPSEGDGGRNSQWTSQMSVELESPQPSGWNGFVQVGLFVDGRGPCSSRLETKRWKIVVDPAPSPEPTAAPTTPPTGATGPTGGTGSDEPPVEDTSTGPTGFAIGNDSFDDETVEALPFEEGAPKEFIQPDRSRFVLAVDGPGGVSTDPVLILTNGLLALLLTLVILAPGTLLESTLEANLQEVKGWFGWTRTETGGAKGILRRLARSRLGLALIATLTALLYGFLSPDFSVDEASIALLLGIFGAILLITFVKEWTTGYFVRRATLKKAYLRVFPGALLVGIACVAISRLAGFEPGYLWALVAVVAFRGTVGNVQGKALAIASGALLLLGVGTWVALTPIREALSDPNPSFGLLVLEALLVATFVAALEGLFFGLMPLRFLDGQKIIDWNRWVWFGLFALTLFAFLHLLLNPASGYFGWSSEIPAMLVIGLFAGFSLFSVSFWAYFRFRQST